MSLRTNIESFQTHLLNDLDYHFDIFRFNETKITTSIELALDPKIPGYDFHGARSLLWAQAGLDNSHSSRNMSRTRSSASSRVPNTKKEMKARGRRPTAFICLFDVFGIRDEARSPSFRHVLSNETIENYAVTCFPLYCFVSISSLLINKAFH